MKYCCSHFTRLADNAGKKGIAVIHVVRMGGRQFLLQARPFDQDVFDYHSQVDAATGRNIWPVFRNADGHEKEIRLVDNVVLRYCPGCGCELAGLISRNMDAFDEREKEQRDLLKL